MRSKPQFNYPAFADAAAKLRARGWMVYSPAEMDTRDGIRFDPAMGLDEQHEHASDHTNARRYARRDLNVITNLLRAEWGDAVVVLPEWHESIGASAEVAVARWVGLRVIPLETALAPTE